MSHPNHHWLWFEAVVPDTAAGAAFYQQVLNWTPHAADMGSFVYTMLGDGEKNWCGLMSMPDGQLPPQWASYLGVEDVDAAVAAVQAHGGSLLIPPFDIPEVGRTALVADPQGATVFLFRGADDSTPSSGFHWVELQTPDVEASLAFYRDALGFETSTMDMGGMPYGILSAGDGMTAGVMPLQGDGPPRWLPYAKVPDVDDALDRAAANGATIALPATSADGIGRWGWIVDPQGAMVALMTPEATNA